VPATREEIEAAEQAVERAGNPGERRVAETRRRLLEAAGAVRIRTL